MWHLFMIMFGYLCVRSGGYDYRLFRARVEELTGGLEGYGNELFRSTMFSGIRYEYL